jgi:hypothetical protein
VTNIFGNLRPGALKKGSQILNTEVGPKISGYDFLEFGIFTYNRPSQTLNSKSILYYAMFSS